MASIYADAESARPIWRVPAEVWCMVFLETTQVQGEIPLQDHMGAAYIPPGFTALHITAVCRRWRVCAMSYGRLWCNITLTWNKWKPVNIPRIRHYHALAVGTPLSLTISGTQLELIEPRDSMSFYDGAPVPSRSAYRRVQINGRTGGTQR
jgi:hypothetical protein